MPETSSTSQEKFEPIIEAHAHVSFVILSDLFLDHPKTFRNLERMLEVYADSSFRPLAFVLCGNFSSIPCTVGGAAGLAKYTGRSDRNTFPNTSRSCFAFATRILHRSWQPPHQVSLTHPICPLHFCPGTQRSLELNDTPSTSDPGLVRRQASAAGTQGALCEQPLSDQVLWSGHRHLPGGPHGSDAPKLDPPRRQGGRGRE